MTSHTQPPKIAFITAIYGNYEQNCKPFVTQSIPCDFICFTDNSNIQNNNWIIDNTPHHILHKSSCDTSHYVNSLHNNTHSFNIAKYYKQAFINIPTLKKYECIVWLDATLQITHLHTAKYVLTHIYAQKIIGWGHERCNGNLLTEIQLSIHPSVKRYSSTFWFGQSQPFQDLSLQYNTYITHGYTNDHWLPFQKHFNNPLIGVWCTCFVAFLQHDTTIQQFLKLWYSQTIQFTTQDQIGFSFALQKMMLCPLTLPNQDIQGKPHSITDFFIKHKHQNYETGTE